MMELNHEHRLTAVEEKAARNEGRIKALEEEQSVIHKLATSVAVMAEQQKNISDKVDTIDSKVDAIEAKPAKLMDGIVDKLIAAAVGAFLAWCLSGTPGV